MILVDTSVWIDHLRTGDGELITQLDSAQVLTHPFVIGELACGNLRNRNEVLALMGNLPKAVMANDDEVLYFIEQHRLMGRGIGYVDAHLLAAASLSDSVRFWTRDKRLGSLAAELKLRYLL